MLDGQAAAEMLDVMTRVQPYLDQLRVLEDFKLGGHRLQVTFNDLAIYIQIGDGFIVKMFHIEYLQSRTPGQVLADFMRDPTVTLEHAPRRR